MNEIAIQSSRLLEDLHGKEIVVRSRNDAEVVANAIRLCNDYTKQVEEAFDEHIKAAHLQHKSLLAKKALYVKTAEEVDKACRSALSAWATSVDGADTDGITGVSFIKTEKVECDDRALKNIVKMICDGKLPLRTVSINEKVLLDCINAGVEVKGVKIVTGYSPRIR